MIKKALKGARHFFNNKPLNTISVILSIKDAAFGLGFILAAHEITQTLIYQNVSLLLPAAFFGWILLIVALVTAISAIADKAKYSRCGLEIMALFWLFAAFTYMWAGSVLLMAVALAFSLLPGYISFYYKFEGVWNESRRRRRLQRHAAG